MHRFYIKVLNIKLWCQLISVLVLALSSPQPCRSLALVSMCSWTWVDLGLRDLDYNKALNYKTFLCLSSALWFQPTCCNICNNTDGALREHFCLTNFAVWLSIWMFNRRNPLHSVPSVCVCVCERMHVCVCVHISLFEMSLHYPLQNNVLFKLDGGSAL